MDKDRFSSFFLYQNANIFFNVCIGGKLSKIEVYLEASAPYRETVTFEFKM